MAVLGISEGSCKWLPDGIACCLEILPAQMKEGKKKTQRLAKGYGFITGTDGRAISMVSSHRDVLLYIG